jgi:hypothetical protein
MPAAKKQQPLSRFFVVQRQQSKGRTRRWCQCILGAARIGQRSVQSTRTRNSGGHKLAASAGSVEEGALQPSTGKSAQGTFERVLCTPLAVAHLLAAVCILQSLIFEAPGRAVGQPIHRSHSEPRWVQPCLQLGSHGSAYHRQCAHSDVVVLYTVQQNSLRFRSTLHRLWLTNGAHSAEHEQLKAESACCRRR